MTGDASDGDSDVGPDPEPGVVEEVRHLRERADDETLERLDRDVEARLSRLGKAHALSVMRLFSIEGGPWRFSEFEERLDVPPDTLSERLGELTDAGLLERHSYDEIPPRVEYTWTETAAALTPAMQELYLWAKDHDFDPGGEA